MLGYHPEAMIVIGVDQSERARRLLAQSGIPVVQAMDMTDDPIDLNVGFDHRAPAWRRCAILRARASAHIAHLDGHRPIPRAGRRADGYLRGDGGASACRPRGWCSRRAVDHGASAARAVCARCWRIDPSEVSAVFACNDDLRSGRAVRVPAAWHGGVPDDVAIMGFNDLDLLGGTMPTLTNRLDRTAAGWATGRRGDRRESSAAPGGARRPVRRSRLHHRDARQHRAAQKPAARPSASSP